MVTGDVLKRHCDGSILLITILDVPGYFLDDDDLLLLCHLKPESRASEGRIGVVAVYDGCLDVLRGVLRSANDDRVLDAAGDKKLAAVDEPEVAGPQIAPPIG